MEREKILAKIKEADMILVGLGEEFDDSRRLKDCEEYVRGCRLLAERGCSWLRPAWNEYCSAKLGGEDIKQALQKLAGLLEDKNYFVVATATDSRICETAWKQGRLVIPCGSARKKQCGLGCGHAIIEVSPADRETLQETFHRLYEGIFPKGAISGLGKCPQCGGDMILNNIYAENYNEAGYQEQWQLYTKWLQGTLNHRLTVLELGVSMRFPSVIRWPFEKAAYFNKKAFFIRVNETLYQLTEELGEKGVGIPMNTIDWLQGLC